MDIEEVVERIGILENEPEKKFCIWQHQIWRDSWNPNPVKEFMGNFGRKFKGRSTKGVVYTNCILFNHGEFYIHLN